MKAAYIQNARIEVGTFDDPVPGKGQALVRTHSCGMCASEAHFLHAGQRFLRIEITINGADVFLCDPGANHFTQMRRHLVRQKSKRYCFSAVAANVWTGPFEVIQLAGHDPGGFVIKSEMLLPLRQHL
jgi:hypothetical protein